MPGFGQLGSLVERVLKLDPAHDYEGREDSTIGEEIATNPRLQQRDRAAFVAMMNSLNLTMPKHITEALRTNMSGGKTVALLLAEAAAKVPFMSLAEVRSRVEAGNGLLVLDVRERSECEAGHIPGAKLLPRGQLELRVNEELPDPTRRIVATCELGYISTLAAATLREMGFQHAVALDGGMKAWRALGYPVETGAGRSFGALAGSVRHTESHEPSQPLARLTKARVTKARLTKETPPPSRGRLGGGWVIAVPDSTPSPP